MADIEWTSSDNGMLQFAPVTAWKVASTGLTVALKLRVGVLQDGQAITQEFQVGLRPDQSLELAQALLLACQRIADQEQGTAQ